MNPKSVRINKTAYYYFKLKHDIQNDSELALAKLEIENLMGKQVREIINFVDVLSKQPLNDFITEEGFRVQDVITHLPYCGKVQGYLIKDSIRDCRQLVNKLAYFRDFYVLLESNDVNLAKIIYPDLNIKKVNFDETVNLYDKLAPYSQLFTMKKDTPKMLFRFIPLNSLYETSDFICRLSRKIADVDRMFEASIKHLQKDFYRPFSPSSARWFKEIEDFMDDRRAPQLYLTHYIFGIKGKFFPRMIAAIMNIIGIKKEDILLDPFCGCGTLNVESSIHEVDSIGVDINPLLTMMSKVKTKSLLLDIKWLKRGIENLLKEEESLISSEFREYQTLFDRKPKVAEVFIPPTLMKNIRKDSLRCVQIIKGCIESLDDENLKKFCELPLAYWMRSMLRKFTPQKIFQTYSQYLWSMFYSVYYFHKFRENIYNFELGKTKIWTGDVRNLKNLPEPIEDEKIDGIITSPPYGTAIDYIGEQSHSLYVLNLTKDHLKLDKAHIGSPRISNALNQSIINESKEFKNLPILAQDTLKKMNSSGVKKSAAFYKYFVNMHQAFREMYRVLRPNKYLVMIIGKQQEAKADRYKVTIELGRIMEEIAKEVGFTHLNSIDVLLQKASERGAIPTEHIIFFKKEVGN